MHYPAYMLLAFLLTATLALPGNPNEDEEIIRNLDFFAVMGALEHQAMLASVRLEQMKQHKNVPTQTTTTPNRKAKGN